jgi:catechol 2,3-dioxygenase-like lactoylglutathione lyase family enzyme
MDAISSGVGTFAVKDMAAAARFYRDTLGLHVVEQPLGVPGANVPSGLRLELPGGSAVLIYPKPDHAPASFTVLTLSVRDLESVVDELTSRGVRFERYDNPRTDARGIHRNPDVRPVAWFTDPSGNVIALTEDGS